MLASAKEKIQETLAAAMTSIPKTQKIQVFEKAKTPLVLKEVEVKQPGDGEILVKSIACGVCHSDSFVREGMMGSFPRIPGHEVIGDVVAVGPGAENRWKVGDRVGGGWHGGHDNTCTNCEKGIFQCCDNELINGVTKDGGYQQYVTLRSEAAVRIPKEVDPAEAAPLLCAGLTLFNSIRNMGLVPGDTVAVQGLGGLGHLGIQYANKLGFKTIGLSQSDSKKDFAKQLGAHDYISGSAEQQVEALNKQGGAKLIIITAPNPEPIPKLQNGLAVGGTLLILAPVGDVSVNSVNMVTKMQSIRGWPSGHQYDAEDTIRFSQVHGVKCMIEKFPFEKANDAMEHMESGKVRFRSVLVFD